MLQDGGGGDGSGDADGDRLGSDDGNGLGSGDGRSSAVGTMFMTNGKWRQIVPYSSVSYQVRLQQGLLLQCFSRSILARAHRKLPGQHLNERVLTR